MEPESAVWTAVADSDYLKALPHLLCSGYQLSVNHIHRAILCSPRLNKDKMIISSAVFLYAITREGGDGQHSWPNSQGAGAEKCLRTTPLDLILGELSARKPCLLLLENPQNTNSLTRRAAQPTLRRGMLFMKPGGSKGATNRMDAQPRAGRLISLQA